jgi:tetratricopeptide (TPR) repeat protein
MQKKFVICSALVVLGGLALVALGSGQSFAASQPDHRPSGQILWFVPSPVIIEGTRLIEEGQAEEGMAMIRLEMTRDLDPADVVSGLNNLCVGHLSLREFTKALKECQKATHLRPKMWEGHNNTGNAKLGMGDVAGAIPDYQRALALNPESVTVQNNLAMAERYLAEDAAKK